MGGIGSQIGSAIAPLIIVPIAASLWMADAFFCDRFHRFGLGMDLLWMVPGFSFANEKRYRIAEKQMIESSCRHDKRQELVSWKLIFRNSTLWPLMGMYFCIQWANYFFVAWMPVYLQEGRGFSENAMKKITSLLFVVGIVGFLTGGAASDWFLKHRGLKKGRRITGMLGLGVCAFCIFLTAISSNDLLTVASLIGGNFSFAFGVMVSYAVCADIGRNNAGTVTGAMNFFGQIGAFSLALIFGKIVQVTHHFDWALFLVSFVLLLGVFSGWPLIPEKQFLLLKKNPDGMVPGLLFGKSGLDLETNHQKIINLELARIPLSKRPVDIAIIVFFFINLFFITYIVDLEQLVITGSISL